MGSGVGGGGGAVGTVVAVGTLVGTVVAVGSSVDVALGSGVGVSVAVGSGVAVAGTDVAVGIKVGVVVGVALACWTTGCVAERTAVAWTEDAVIAAPMSWSNVPTCDRAKATWTPSGGRLTSTNGATI